MPQYAVATQALREITNLVKVKHAFMLKKYTLLRFTSSVVHVWLMKSIVQRFFVESIFL